MSTPRQKAAARRNIRKAVGTQQARRAGARIPERSEGLSTRSRSRLAEGRFAFPEQRKEPLTDARHVRNAVARFDQVEGVTDAERDRAWRRIRAAARTFGVDIDVRGWRSLLRGGKARKV